MQRQRMFAGLAGGRNVRKLALKDKKLTGKRHTILNKLFTTGCKSQVVLGVGRGGGRGGMPPNNNSYAPQDGNGASPGRQEQGQLPHHHPRVENKPPQGAPGPGPNKAG